MGGTFLITFILNVSYFVLNIHIVNGKITFSHGSTCDYGNMYGTHLYQLSLETCKKECGVRPSCEAFAYFRREQKCSILSTADGYDSTEGDRNCLHMTKQYIKQLDVCNCLDNEACDPISSACSIKECGRFADVENAVVLGSMTQVGSRLKIVCATGYREAEQQDTVTCLPDGTWSYQPICIKITIGEACNTSIGIDCKETSSVCIEGRCFCGPLHRYNTTSMDCVKVCSRMMDKFTKYSDIIIWNLNQYLITSVGEQCMAYCIAYPACQSYEYEANRPDDCFTNFATYEMVVDATPDLIYPMPGGVLFSRNCE